MAHTSRSGTETSGSAASPLHIWTLGHSTRSEAEFLCLLSAHNVQAIADVRRFPGSRRQPQFKQEDFRRWLGESGIEYRWFEDLGGRRKPHPDSPNTAWRNPSFRAYADYMSSPQFEEAFAELLKLAGRLRTAIMCAELLWWRCHRALVSDALLVRGIAVTHIVDESHTTEHPYTSAARIVRGRLSYEAPRQQSLL